MGGGGLLLWHIKRSSWWRNAASLTCQIVFLHCAFLWYRLLIMSSWSYSDHQEQVYCKYTGVGLNDLKLWFCLYNTSMNHVVVVFTDHLSVCPNSMSDPKTAGADAGSVVSDPQHSQKLLRVLQFLRQEDCFQDAVLVLDGEQIPVQKNILAAASPYIRYENKLESRIHLHEMRSDQ